MSISLHEFGSELLKKIMVAGSQEEVKNIIDNLLKGLEETNANSQAVARFVETGISQLETLDPMNKDSKQWSNINMARIHLHQIKREFDLPS